MSATVEPLLVFFFALKVITVNCDVIPVRILAKEHVNEVSDKFLSFTVDPKFLVDKNGVGIDKDCLCMAQSLSPAYIRLAGPATTMDFQNSTVLFNNTAKKNQIAAGHDSSIAVDAEKWKAFAEWAKTNKFELVIALDNERKTEAGIWDPNVALSILSAAERANIENVVWQLGYECRGRTAEEYLGELETLRVMVDTLRAGAWRVAGGELAGCRAVDAGSRFGEYVAGCAELLDAVFLNGNATALQLEKMKEDDRRSLLEMLSNSDTPLWITETRDNYTEFERAADWMTSLGLSARNGFDVHFREILEEELHEPTLSFYMALLFKNLVGSRVLDVEIHDDISITNKAPLFAHCTTLKHQPVPGAITLFGSNMDDQVVRFSIKLAKIEEGGDIMQFVLSKDRNGNTIVNGHPIFYDGDIKPAVKRVRPYKTLLITLPPKSFGFWVLANTKIEACHQPHDKLNSPNFIPATPVEEIREKMSFAHNKFQSRKKRGMPSLRNDVILHKWIKNNEIFKTKYINPELENIDNFKTDPFDELDELTKNVNDLQKTLAEVQNLVNVNFFDNIAQNARDLYNSDNEDDLAIKPIYRQKRQTFRNQLRTAVSKLKTSSKKETLTQSGSTTEPQLVKATLGNDTKIRNGTEKQTGKETRFNKKINLRHKGNMKNLNTLQVNEVHKNILVGAQPKSTLKDSKVRLQEFRSRLQTRKNKATEKLAVIKEGLASKRTSTGINDDLKIRHIHKFPVKTSENIFHGKPLSLFRRQQLHKNVINYPQKTASVVERKKRNTEGSNEQTNAISSDANKSYNKRKIEGAQKSVFKNILRNINEKLDIAPLIELSEGDKDSDDVSQVKTAAENKFGDILGTKNNVIPKKKNSGFKNEAMEDQVLVKTKISDEDASISIGEKSSHRGLLKTTMEGVSSLLKDLRENFSRIWAIIPTFQ